MSKMYIAYVKDAYRKDIYGLDILFETKAEAKEYIIAGLKSNAWTYSDDGGDICIGEDDIVVIDNDFDEARISLHFCIEPIAIFTKDFYKELNGEDK